jgi:hypothetical protein
MQMLFEGRKPQVAQMHRAELITCDSCCTCWALQNIDARVVHVCVCVCLWACVCVCEGGVANGYFDPVVKVSTSSNQ